MYKSLCCLMQRHMDKKRLFDVAMGIYNGAEVCEPVGTFLLDEISK